MAVSFNKFRDSCANQLIVFFFSIGIHQSSPPVTRSDIPIALLEGRNFYPVISTQGRKFADDGIWKAFIVFLAILKLG